MVVTVEKSTRDLTKDKGRIHKAREGAGSATGKLGQQLSSVAVACLTIIPSSPHPTFSTASSHVLCLLAQQIIL